MQKLSILLIWSLLLWIGTGCTEAFEKKMRYKPAALGEANEITIIADDDWWKAGLQDTALHYFAAPFIITPQPEPILKVRHFSAVDLDRDPLKRGLRMYLIISDLSDTASPTTQMVIHQLGMDKINKVRDENGLNNVILKDVWAQDQRVIYTFSKDKTQFYDHLRRQAPAILNAIQTHDQKKVLATTYVEGKDLSIEKKIDSTLNVRIDIPEGFFIAVREHDLIWIRKETQEVSLNMMIKRIPYRDQEQLTEAGMKSVFEEMGKYVSTDSDGSYMTLNDRDFPTFVYKKKIEELYALEMRGIWEMNNDFMGGPYAFYAILDDSEKSIIAINNFVFAPSKSKRNLMQQLECIVGTIRFKSEDVQ